MHPRLTQLSDSLEVKAVESDEWDKQQLLCRTTMLWVPGVAFRVDGRGVVSAHTEFLAMMGHSSPPICCVERCCNMQLAQSNNRQHQVTQQNINASHFLPQRPWLTELT